MEFGKRHENLAIVLTASFLAAGGCLMVYSATSVTQGRPDKFGADPAFFLKRQVLFFAVGSVLGIILSRIDYGVYRKWIWALLGMVFLALAAVFVPGIGHRANGAARWLALGSFTFQPSELAKFVLLMFAALMAEKAAEDRSRAKAVWVRAIAVMGLFVGIILIEPDFGMTMVIAGSFVVVLFIAGLPVRWLAALGVVAAAGTTAAVLFAPYRMQRLLAFLHPMENAQGAAYQVVQSLVAFSNGGLLGVGFGGGMQKLGFLPEIHTDYIISVVAEEGGFVTVTLLGAFYIFLVILGFRVARRARDLFGRYLAMGISFVIGFQAMLNIMVGLSMLPSKGMVLPFLSYGGSSLVIHLMAVGVLVNISMKGAEAHVSTDDDRRRRDRRPRFSSDRGR